MRKSLFIAFALVCATGLFAGACTQGETSATQTATADLQGQVTAQKQEIATLKNHLSNVALNAVSGGGINLKMMPDPTTMQPTVPMEEVFSFNRSHAMCLVADNPKAFAMPTNSMGTVTIQPHSFYMAMDATSIDETTIKTLPNGHTQVTMIGGLNCATEVAQATTTIGSRTAPEHADYTIVAEDGGAGGGKAGDSFKFTVRFDKDKAPINFAIFGPEFTFTGDMTSGEIIIVDPSKLPTN